MIDFLFFAVKTNNKENVTTKIFNKKCGGEKRFCKEGSGGGGRPRKLCRKKSRSLLSWFEGKEASNGQHYALLPLEESERSDISSKSTKNKFEKVFESL